jgi:hypothetical protein
MLVRPVVRFVQTIKRVTGVSLPVTNECGNECFMTRVSLVAIAFVIAPWTAVAAPCPGNPDALGTERVLEVDAKNTPRIGRKQFPSTLPLREKEVVLTFDDGPWPGPLREFWMPSRMSACVRLFSFLDEIRQRIRKSPGEP